MSREYLVTRLLSGKNEAPGRTRWWPRHSGITSRYLQAAIQGEQKTLVATRDLAIASATEWECLAHRTKNGLMAEHALLELELVDAALRTDVDGINIIGEHLTRNARIQTEALRAKIDGFPADHFLALFAAHITLFIDSVESKMVGDDIFFDKSEEKRRANTIALAGLSTEWI